MKGALCVLCFSGALAAQTWETGAAAAGSFYLSRPATAPAGRADAGFGRGPAVSGFFGQNLYPHLGGELRYTFQRNSLRLCSGPAAAAFSGHSHAVHYDAVVYPLRSAPQVRPFVAAGAGFKNYRGTGREAAWQPLGDFALLTRTQEWKPLLTAGAGLKWTVAPAVAVRVEFRDYMTPFPAKVIAPAPGARLGGWMHSFVPLAGISFQR